MELTFADLEVQNVELLPNREALGGWGGWGGFRFTDIDTVVASNRATALFGSVATAVQIITVR
ncbi:hypothetical protein [Gandjariella thermophila]|uniref:Uncharacterized protein n=1 Tax=Gandjariella thermophila TaxID=1931992 RepID=A0A4D4J1Q1_9PSEU|nr:hypothetical protein [Gandjariella thermophila]GDY28718.1 hypothetical protein GTS_03510 [Gandjariella thermophila]